MQCFVLSKENFFSNDCLVTVKSYCVLKRMLNVSLKNSRANVKKECQKLEV